MRIRRAEFYWVGNSPLDNKNSLSAPLELPLSIRSCDKEQLAFLLDKISSLSIEWNFAIVSAQSQMEQDTISF